MKTRVLHTSMFLEDDWFSSLSLKNKFMFIYFFSNSHIGMTGFYLLPERVIKIETGATKKEIDEAKTIFQQSKKIAFLDDWVYVVNAEKYSNYKGGKNQKAYKKELEKIESSIRTTLIDSVSIGYVYRIDTTRNQKSEIRNQKSGVVRGIGGNSPETEQAHDTASVADPIETALTEWIAHYNSVFSTTFGSKAVRKNFEYWLEQYTLDQMKEAVTKARRHEFWHDKLSPVKMLRQEDQKGQSVDRIGEFLAYTPKVTKKFDRLQEIARQEGLL